MNLLIIGATGFLGTHLLHQATAAGHTVAATHHHTPPDPTRTGIRWSPLDLRSRDHIHHLITTLRPDAVINAAYQQSDWPTTAQGPAHLAQATTRTHTRLVHVSSDAVFSGHAPSYDETAHPDPTTPYGAAKAAAETAITALDPTAAIARTSLIIGQGDSPHEHRVRALATGNSTGALFTDDIRCPTGTDRCHPYRHPPPGRPPRPEPPRAGHPHRPPPGPGPARAAPGPPRPGRTARPPGPAPGLTPHPTTPDHHPARCPRVPPLRRTPAARADPQPEFEPGSS